MRKTRKMVKPRFEIPNGSHAVTPFVFELDDLLEIARECKRKESPSMAIALMKIHDDIQKNRDSYLWIEPK